MTPTNVDKHIDQTYFYLRIGLALLALFFPFVLLLVGWYLFDIPFQAKLSAYYFAFAPPDSQLRVFPMRDWLVGILWAIGCFLILYRGFSRAENWTLNLAGLSALGIAMFPTSPPDYCTHCGDGWPITHQVLSVALFVCIAFVAWALRWQTLPLLSDVRLRMRFHAVYRAVAIAMVLAPLVAVWLSVAGVGAPQKAAALPGDIFASATLLTEIFAICIFAVFWLIKTYELHIIEARPAARHADFESAAGALTDGERNSVSMRLNKLLVRRQ
ncbi:MAG: hypothetical protein J2P50_06060 [Hyphomicrobiaceae bacterium]|nr:hypothetical protein [Hyphomicrobiaceae bacterium]